MMDKHPTEFQRALVEEATYLRGRILTSYAQVEFLLADISVKLDLKFPYLIKKRIKAVQRIAERPQYDRYKAELSFVCDRLLEYDDLRNFMAHGFVKLTTDKAQRHQFEMRLYQRSESDAFELVTLKTTIEKLRESAEQIGRYVEESLSIFSRIYLEMKLEDPESSGLV